MVDNKRIKSVNILLLLIISMMISSKVLAQDNQRLAAYEGNPEAQFKLALTYSQGQTNYRLAAYWYTQAARQGMANAQYNLGHFYLQGLGVKQETAKTIQWWKQAAHQNYPPAQHNIGTAYFEGIGVEKNAQLAKQWFERCAGLGSQACMKSLAIVEENIESPTAVTDADPIEVVEQNTESSSATTKDVASTSAATPPNDGDTVNIAEKVSISAHIQASANSTIIAQLTSLDDFTIINSDGNDANKDSKGWQQIQLNKPVAIWCYKKFVSISENTGQLIADKVRARTEPSTKTGKVVTELAKGTKLRVLQEKEQWVQLALTNHIAWTPAIEQELDKKSKEKPIIAKLEDNSPSETKTVKTATETKTTIAADPSINTKATIKAPTKLRPQYTFPNQRSDDEWLFKSDPEQFTLLMANFDNSEKLAQFVAQMGFVNNEKAHLLLAKRDNIEWKYVLYDNFKNKQAALQAAKSNGFSDAYAERIGDIQEQRCSAWKTTIPSPKKLALHCLKKTTFNS